MSSALEKLTGILHSHLCSRMMNGTTAGAPSQPAPTPVPHNGMNGDIKSSKTVKWSGTDRDLIEIQKTGAAIGKLSLSKSYLEPTGMLSDQDITACAQITHN